MEKELIEKREKKPGIGSYVALAAFLLIFSGALKNVPVLNVFDIQSLSGAFGIVKGAEGNFVGAGGTGASQGFALCLSLMPIVMLCMGIVELTNHYGAQLAASQLFSPIMKPLMGVPGTMAISLVSSLNISDIGAATTRDMFEQGEITEDERVKMIAFQFPSCALINNLVTLMGMTVGIVYLSTSAYLLILIVIKFICCNIMRLIMKTRFYKKETVSV